MPDRRRRRAPEEGEGEAAVARETKMTKVEEGGGSEPAEVLDVSGAETEKEVKRLRERWELASVLDFLRVFEPIIEKAPNISAEEIEIGLIKPNILLVQLHVKLLKGIPPVSKALDCSDGWVTILLKKLNPWWPWVAEGQIPLKIANGEEISKYKELDPIDRLLILKALCELRAEQDDAVLHVNDTLKDGNQISYIRKEKVADDGKETSYWYDGNSVIGHRLYRATVKSNLSKKLPKTKSNKTGALILPDMSFQWETLATNLEEFQQVADELASSKERAKTAISGIMESDMIPVLQQLKKSKEQAIKRREKQMALLISCRSSYAAVSSRSRRSARPISYTFEDYDRAINEAIQVTQKRKITQGHIKQRKQGELQVEDSISLEGSDADMDANSEDPSPSKTSIEDLKEPGADDDDDDYHESADVKEEVSETSLDSHESDRENSSSEKRPKAPGVRWSKRLAGETNQTAEETMKVNTRNLLRQRPVQNSAIDSSVVPDSEDEDGLG